VKCGGEKTSEVRSERAWIGEGRQQKYIKQQMTKPYGLSSPAGQKVVVPTNRTMALQGRHLVAKYLMIFFNFLFFLSGLTLMILGATIYVKYGDVFTFADNKFANLPLILMVMGASVFIVSFLGCRGADKENACMLLTFSILLGVILVAIATISGLGFAYKNTVDQATDKALTEAVAQYNSTSGSKPVIDWVQEHLECCGGNGPSDYGNTTCDGNPGVESCYDNGKCSGKLFEDGCKENFIEFVEKRLQIVCGAALGSTVIQVLGIVLSCCLMRVVNSGYTEI